MENMNVTIKGTKLVIEIDLTQEVYVVEKSGNTMIATSAGFAPLPNVPGYQLAVNLIRKKGVAAYKAPRRTTPSPEVEQTSL